MNKAQLRQSYDEHLKEMNELNLRRNEGTASVEDLAKLDSVLERMEDMQKQFKQFEIDENAIEARMQKLEEQKREQRDNPSTHSGAGVIDDEQRRDNLRNWLLGDYQGLGKNMMIERFFSTRDITKAASTAAGATAGAAGTLMVPETLAPSIVEEMKAYGGMLELGTVVRTSTNNEYTQPTWDDTSNKAMIVDEAGSVGVAANPSIGFKKLPAYKYSSGVMKVSREALRDENYDIEGLLRRNFATRFGRALNEHFTLGDGSGKPRGMVLDARAVPATTQARVDSDDITFDVIVKVESALDRAYRNNARWMFNSQTLSFVKLLKDGDMRPLWIPAISVNAPSTILGYPYTVNDDMDGGMADADNAKFWLMFGDFNVYHRREVAGIEFRSLNELYAENDQVGFLMLATYGGASMHHGDSASSVLKLQAAA